MRARAYLIEKICRVTLGVGGRESACVEAVNVQPGDDKGPRGAGPFA